MSAVPPSLPNVLAPVAGSVGTPTTGMLTTGHEVPVITLEPGLQEAPAEPAPSKADGAAKLEDLLRTAQLGDLSRHSDALRLAGVWADRWTSPDLLGQLQQCLKRPVDTVLCSALDFDGFLPLQQTAAREFAGEVVAAVALLGALTGATRAMIVVDAGSTGGGRCTRAVERCCTDTGVRAIALRNSYPQPNPTLLVHAVARRQLRPGRLPTEAGVLLLDALAAVDVGRCLLSGQPALDALVGVADMRAASPVASFLSVPVGMTVADLLGEAGGGTTGPFELRASSPLREVRLPPESVISAGGEAALYLVAPQPALNPAPCIRCGWCVSGCPVHIHPAGLLEAAQTRDRLAAERFGLDSCIECGICSYVCPSHLPLLGGIRSLRATTH
jgi:electron transport complex protein RnfC